MSRASSGSMRKRFALAVIGLHALLFWLVVIMHRLPPEEEPQPPRSVAMWIEPLAPQQPPSVAATVRPRRVPEAAPRAAPQSPPRHVVSPTVAPPAAPTVSESAEQIPPAAAAPPVDWRSESMLAGRRAVDAAAAAAKAETFSPPPKPIAPACKPKQGSMEWKGAQNDGLHWAGPMPVFKTRRCIVTIIGFACNPGWIPPANSHLLDDMDAADQSPSSVPDPNHCD